MQTSVLNLRLSDDLKAAIAAEAIRDGRSMSQVALRALTLGMAAITAPPAPPAPPAAKAKPTAPKPPTTPKPKAKPAKAKPAKAKARP
jgi:hypothetical protein